MVLKLSMIKSNKYLVAKRIVVCYSDIRRNVFYGTKTKKKQKVAIVGDFISVTNNGWSSDVFGMGQLL